jgi:hypothetical protein
MPLYGNLIYGSGATYGQAASLPYSVEPFSATALWYDSILLSWVPSQSNYKAFRLLRNQNHMPESPEDGIKLLDWNIENANATALASQNSYLDTSVIDGVEIPQLKLIQGRFTYYRVWLLDDNDVWVIAGETAVLLPKQYGLESTGGKSTHVKLLELLPNQFISADQSVYGELDYTSDLARFLEGFSFTLDEYITYINLIQPDNYGDFISPTILSLQGYQTGITPEYQTVSKTQKKLIRESIYIYQRKGTELSLGTFAESTTGYAPSITVSPNLLLSVEDSSFYKGIGNWKTFGNVTFTSVDNEPTSAAETAACDTVYAGKAVVGSANASVGLGVTQPVTLKVPVGNIKELTLSYYAKTSSSTNTVTPKITWYNYLGEELSSAVGSGQSINTTWAKKTLTAWPPGFIGTITDISVASNVVTVTLDSTHPFIVGNSVTIAGVDSTFTGNRTITGVTSNSFTFSLTTSNQSYTQLSGSVRLASWEYKTQAKYASIQLTFSSTGTVFLDYVQLAPSTVSSYSDARAVDLSLAPSKINYLLNPAFLETGDAWTIDATASDYVPTDVVGVYGGLTMLEVETKASGTTTVSATTPDNLPVDKFYTFSIFGKSPDADQEVSLTITATDLDASEVVDTQTVTATLTDIWNRFSVTTFVPPTAGNVEIEVSITVEDSGETIYFDCAQVETSPVLTDYIDGSMPTDYYTGWSGTAHESTSHQYINKEVRLARLTSEIEKYLPINTAYRVLTDDGVEVANITY